MINNKSHKRFYHELSIFIMLLIALIVRSTTQKDEKTFPHPQRYHFDIDTAWRRVLSLDGTGKSIAIVVEGT